MSPSLDLRDWNSPASRPYFSVVSSAVGVDGAADDGDCSTSASLSVLNMRRADDGDEWGCCLDDVDRWWMDCLWFGRDDDWKECAPSNIARATMSDFVKRKVRDRIVVL